MMDNRIRVMYGRSNTYHVGKGISAKIVLSCVDWMDSVGYLRLSKGWRSCERGQSLLSRMSDTEKLSSIYKKFEPAYEVVSLNSHPMINIRDSKKNNSFDSDGVIKLFGLIDDFETGCSDLEKQIIINKLRSTTKVSLINKTIPLPPLRRIFNDSSFSKGGRFYCCPIQKMSSKNRKELVINGVNSVEIDFSCMHLQLLYDISNKPLIGDAYTQGVLSNYPRKMVKMALLIMINAECRQSAVKAIIKERAEAGCCEKFKAGALLDDINKEHHLISDYFCSGHGVNLQYLDGAIALEVMFHFADQGIACLSVHDSFIVPDCHSEELKRVMKEKYKERMILYSVINDTTYYQMWCRENVKYNGCAIEYQKSSCHEGRLGIEVG
jgi:hypothetical protein